MPSIPRWTPSSSPAAPARPLRRWIAAGHGASAHDTGSISTSAPPSRSCATTTRRAGGRRGGTGTATRARRGCPRPTAARPARRADFASHRTAPLPHPARRLRRPVRRLDPRPATSPRTRRRRPRPRRAPERPPTGAAGRTGTGGSRGRPPLCFLSGRRHATTVTVASGSGDLTPLQPTLSEAADVTRAPAPAHASPSHFRVHSVSVRRASGTPAETDGPRV